MALWFIISSKPLWNLSSHLNLWAMMIDTIILGLLICTVYSTLPHSGTLPGLVRSVSYSRELVTATQSTFYSSNCDLQLKCALFLSRTTLKRHILFTALPKSFVWLILEAITRVKTTSSCNYLYINSPHSPKPKGKNVHPEDSSPD